MLSAERGRGHPITQAGTTHEFESGLGVLVLLSWALLVKPDQRVIVLLATNPFRLILLCQNDERPTSDKW